MIIGNGLLARAFLNFYANDPNILVFASGVSNSREQNEAEFSREKIMLQKACKQGKKLIYFSTCSVHDAELTNSPYVQHKLAMEELVSQLSHFAIFRLPQVVGHTPNPHTLTNYLHHQIQTGKQFHIWRNARRNLIDVDDVAKIAVWLINHHHTDDIIMNIACPFSITIPDLVKIFEQIIGVTAHCDIVDAGGKYSIDAQLANSVALQAGVCFDDVYIQHLIRKYYAPQDK